MSIFTSQLEETISETKHFCTYCQDEIPPVLCETYTGYTSKTILIECKTCEEFYLCLPCFSCGAEIGPHKNYHDFKLVTFSIANVFSLNLLNAVEEWVSEDTENYLGEKKLVCSWKDVAKVVGVKDPKEVEKEYFSTFIEGNLGQCVINLVNKYMGYSQVVTLDKAKEMGCFENCPTYFPTFKYLKVPKNPEKLEDYEVLEESIRSNQHYNKDMVFRNKNVFDTYKLQLLLQCVGEFGYGNWKYISQLYNKTIQMEYPQRKRTYLTATQIKEEYLQHFIVNPILRKTWLPLSNNRPQVPDRTKRIEGNLQVDYDHILNTQLPIEDLDIIFYPSKLDDKYKNASIVEKVKSHEFTEKCLVCTYCQDEFEVISYRTNNGAFSYYELLTVYTSCTNKETCDNFYLCLTCLASGAEIGKHKKDHSYKLISEVKRYSSEAYLPGSNWTALEGLALLSASEEWFSDNTDKFINPLNSGNIITDWDSVAQHIRSKNAIESKIQFEKLVLNKGIWQLFELHFPTDFLMTYEIADEMGCFENSNEKITIDITENKNLNKGQKIVVQNKKDWNKLELVLLLEYTAIYGYGNWKKISEELNTTNWLENNKKIDEFSIKTPEEIAEEYLFRFYESPMRRGTWKSVKHIKPIILDRTQFFEQPDYMKYPVVDSNLFNILGYNFATDDFECPYMDTAESDFDVYCSEISLDKDFLNTNNRINFIKHSSKKGSKKTENAVSKLTEGLHMRKYTNITEEKALIAFERYNNVLKDRRTAKKIIHNYRLIEQFAKYKDKELLNIKPLSEQAFEERLVKMARFMTADAYRDLVEGLKNEKLFKNVLVLLKHFYKSKSSIKLTEIDTENISLKRKEPKKQTIVDTALEYQNTTNKCSKFSGPKLSKLSCLKNMSGKSFLTNDKCDELRHKQCYVKNSI